MILKRCIFILFLMLVVQRSVCAERSVDDLQNQALANIKRAQEVVAYAENLIKVEATKENIMLCIDLYVEAALLYGHASRLLKAIGPRYVSQEVVDGFASGESNCLAIVERLRRAVNKGEIIKVERLL